LLEQLEPLDVEEVVIEEVIVDSGFNDEVVVDEVIFNEETEEIESNCVENISIVSSISTYSELSNPIDQEEYVDAVISLLNDSCDVDERLIILAVYGMSESLHNTTGAINYDETDGFSGKLMVAMRSTSYYASQEIKKALASYAYVWSYAFPEYEISPSFFDDWFSMILMVNKPTSYEDAMSDYESMYLEYYNDLDNGVITDLNDQVVDDTIIDEDYVNDVFDGLLDSGFYDEVIVDGGFIEDTIVECDEVETCPDIVKLSGNLDTINGKIKITGFHNIKTGKTTFDKPKNNIGKHVLKDKTKHNKEQQLKRRQ